VEFFLGVPPNLEKNSRNYVKTVLCFIIFGPILYLGVPTNFFNQISVPQSQKG